LSGELSAYRNGAPYPSERITTAGRSHPVLTDGSLALPILASVEGRPIEAVVFDMDGVLIDSEPIWRGVERAVFARLGVVLTVEDLEETMGVGIAEVVDLRYRRTPWDGPSRAEVVDAIVEGVASVIEETGRWKPGAVEAVSYVEGLGLQVAVSSSSPMRLIRAVLARGGMLEHFDVIRSAEDEGRGKPDPAVYLSTARELGVEPKRCLAVEDSIAGVRSAFAAGMVCVALAESPSADDRFEGAALVLPTLAEFDERVWAATGTTPAPAPAERA
jgi:mannitol-1-/sugar-/sorbitol-6-/2-deoxyglucose-6-phosphatase